ncbi:biorientation of chromosomes in cell division protein 1-like 1 [Battus philenor]|uniref:biorientation of chromosomes in cell division protein 1-like 1 n=1 Tax=Battus philenor TaxID=42288 RepID=UPI0035CEC826
MAHLQYLPGDPRLVDQLVYELKSKGIFDQFRKDCIADVDTRPAYQNLRQRVENSVSTFLSRQCWQPDLNKNQLREKLRKHILDGNYLEQGVERIVDQVVNPKVASVFIPQVEDLVYNYLGITRKKSASGAETSNGKAEDLLPTDLEAVSPGSVKSNEEKNEHMDVEVAQEAKVEDEKMEIVEENPKPEVKEEETPTPETNHVEIVKVEEQKTDLSASSELTASESNSLDKNSIPLPAEEIKLENIPAPDKSPPKVVELEKIELPKEIDCSVDIPLPNETTKEDKEIFFKQVNSDDDDSSSDSSLRRNMSPLTPIRNFNNENSCDAQQGFDNDSLDGKNDDKKEPSSFRFAIETKTTDNGTEAPKVPKKPADANNLAYQFNNQVNISTFNTPVYEDSSNSTHLQIDYESDANSKINLEQKAIEGENSEESKKERKTDDRKSSHKSSHRSRDSHKHSSSKDKRSDSKHSTSRDSSRHDKKPRDDTSKSKTNSKESSRDKSEKKDSKDSSRHSSHKSSSHKDSKSHKSSSSSQRHSSKSSDDRKSSSSHRDRSEKSSDKNNKDKDKPKESKSSSRSDKDRKSSSKSKHEDKDKEKKEKKEADDHYSVSGRGNPNRRSTDRDSNDGSSSSKGSHNPANSKSSESKKDSKNGSAKSDNMSTSSESTSPCDRELTLQEKEKEVIDMLQPKPVVRLESHLETPIASPPRLPFVPDVTIKKPKFAANLEEAKKLIKMRKFLDDEQKRMNQEAALLLEFQANVRPSLSQIYSSIPGPELEFACVTNTVVHTSQIGQQNEDGVHENNVYSMDQSNYAEDEGFSDHVDDDVPSTLTVREVEESIESINEELNNKAKAHASEDTISKESYEALQAQDTFMKVEYKSESKVRSKKGVNDPVDKVQNKNKSREDNKKRTEYFEVTIITEELSENEETVHKDESKLRKNHVKNREARKERVHPEQRDFYYFGEQEKYKAELERDRFSKFFKAFTEASGNKIYLINCNTYEEKIVQEALETFGKFEIVNYQRNGHLKLPKNSKNIVKNVNLSAEVLLPLDNESSTELETKKPVTESVFSPVKSECSFELSSDYDAKLEEMVNKTSRQEIMEIILGNVTADSPTKMPKIDYFTDSNIESEGENNYKRKHSEMETVNNNRHVLTPNKMRRLSTSDQISSTTEDIDERSNNNMSSNVTRSKYLGKAKRVGLPRPRKTDLPNSPSSDKSVENYEQNTQTSQPPNGKIKSAPRNKVQRYDTSDLYKPKLHYLSRRNNVS